MDAIQGIGQFLGNSGTLKGLQLGSAGTGEIGNILNMIQRGQQYSRLKSFENMSPAQLAARVSSATTPLNQRLVQDITNQVQGADAARGLTASPGIFSSDLAQSLAPYEQQNQNTALQLVMSQLGLPLQASSVLNPVSDLGNSFANVFKTFQNNSPTPTITSPQQLLDLVWGGGGAPSPGSGLTDAPVFSSSGVNS